MNPVQKAIDILGGLSALAEAIEESSQTVSNWRSRSVPAERCPDIEAATKGGVTCEELRPDVNWAVLRCKKLGIKTE